MLYHVLLSWTWRWWFWQAGSGCLGWWDWCRYIQLHVLSLLNVPGVFVCYDDIDTLVQVSCILSTLYDAATVELNVMLHWSFLLCSHYIVCSLIPLVFCLSAIYLKSWDPRCSVIKWTNLCRIRLVFWAARFTERNNYIERNSTANLYRCFCLCSNCRKNVRFYCTLWRVKKT